MTTLELTGIVAGYHGREALHGVSLRATAGEVLGLIGPNGAGKTTLLRVVSGTLAPRAGAVTLDGADLLRLRPQARARLVATVPQVSPLPPGFSVAEMVLLGRHAHLPPLAGERQHDYAVSRAAMERTGVWELAGRAADEISGGELQRVLIARALAQEPRVLLLDEATAHLDLRYQAQTMRLARRLARAGLVVVATLHDLNLAALYADRLALLRDGELLAEGLPAAVLAPDLIERAYGVAVVLGRHPLRGTPVISLAEEGDDDE